MCHCSVRVGSLQPVVAPACTAKTLNPSQRIQLAVQALAGSQAITHLAQEHGVSRKFVYQQADAAQTILDEGFGSSLHADDQVLFTLPVTKAWLRQASLALVLICRSSLRGVVEFWRDLIDVRMAPGTVHNILRDAIAKVRARPPQTLGNVRIAALDEIFQGQPVLVGADAASSYCFLLSSEEQRDTETWALRLLELQEQGLAPDATIADFAAALRSGQGLVMPEVPCRGDVFHVLHELLPVVTLLEKRAYQALEVHDKWERKKAKVQHQGRPSHVEAGQAYQARQKADQAVAVADDVAVLARWLRDDVFAVSGLPYADRLELFDFIVDQWAAREPQYAAGLRPIRTLLHNQRDRLLAFAAQLESDLTDLAAEFQVPLDTVRDVLNLQTLSEFRPERWQQEAALRQQLHSRFWSLNEAVQQIAGQVVRASSVVENLNSRLRNYFFLRRQVGPDYLTLLQFFLNHRRFLRSEHRHRVDKSPAELLTGVPHAHWLEMLGYQRFSRN